MIEKETYNKFLSSIKMMNKYVSVALIKMKCLHTQLNFYEICSDDLKEIIIEIEDIKNTQIKNFEDTDIFSNFYNEINYNEINYNEMDIFANYISNSKDCFTESLKPELYEFYKLYYKQSDNEKEKILHIEPSIYLDNCLLCLTQIKSYLESYFDQFFKEHKLMESAYSIIVSSGIYSTTDEIEYGAIIFEQTEEIIELLFYLHKFIRIVKENSDALKNKEKINICEQTCSLDFDKMYFQESEISEEEHDNEQDLDVNLIGDEYFIALKKSFNSIFKLSATSNEQPINEVKVKIKTFYQYFKNDVNSEFCNNCTKQKETTETLQNENSLNETSEISDYYSLTDGSGFFSEEFESLFIHQIKNKEQQVFFKTEIIEYIHREKNVNKNSINKTKEDENDFEIIL